MNPWHQYSFVRIILFYLIGIYTCIWLKQPFSNSLVILLVIIVISSILAYFQKRFSFKFRAFYGIITSFIFIVLGFSICGMHMQKSSQLSCIGETNTYLLRITEPPSKTEKSIKIVGKLSQKSELKQSRPNKEKSILYLQKDSAGTNLKYGDLLLLECNLQLISSPQNPHEFNYKRYLKYKNIYTQAFVQSGGWVVVGQNKSNPIKLFALNIRDYLLSVLGGTNLTNKQQSVAKAILLGHDETLDPETRNEYASAGAMHVLCVSGLHVGIIYLAFNLLLGFLDKSRHARSVKAILLILLIWIYALITGLSPSVLRASIMLNFIILGGAINRKGNIYNTLAASAFLLLLFNPLMIMEVGFQLSYAAVIGIVSIYPLIKPHLYSKNKIIDKVFSVLIISFAAQVGTFPLAIFYFHQFPVYFLLTNLLVVSLAGLIINIGFIYFIVSGLPIVSEGVEFIFKLVLWIMNTYVSIIESLPGSTLRGLILTLIAVIIIYLLMISFVKAIISKSKKWITISLSCLLMLTIMHTKRQIQIQQQYKLTIYSINNQSALEFNKQKSNVLFADSSLILDKNKINYHIQNDWWYSGIKKSELVPINTTIYTKNEIGIFKHNELMLIQNKLILIINNNNWRDIDSMILQPDYLLISGNPKISLVKALEKFKPSLIIIDPSNSYYQEKIWVKEAEEFNIPCHFVRLEGALVRNI